MLCKHDVTVSAVSLRVRRMINKFGIEVPMLIAHTKQLDTKNGDTYWQDAIAKEMANVGIAFAIQDEGVKAPPGWTRANGHLVFDGKMDFTRKYRWVKDGHRTPDPTT